MNLIDNLILAIRLGGFANSEEVDSLVAGLVAHARRTASIEQVTRLGISQYEQGLRISRENYFSLADQLEMEISRIFAASFSPVQRLIDVLGKYNFDAGVMYESGVGKYFAGNGKLRKGYSPIAAGRGRAKPEYCHWLEQRSHAKAMQKKIG